MFTVKNKVMGQRDMTQLGLCHVFVYINITVFQKSLAGLYMVVKTCFFNTNTIYSTEKCNK